MIAGSRLLLLRSVITAVLVGTYAPLYFHAGPYSQLYRAALVAGGLIVAAALFSVLFPRTIRRVLDSTPLSRTRVRLALASAPWVGLIVVTAMRGSWWIQQDSGLRAFATTAAVAWSLAWCAGPWPQVPGRGLATRRVLVAIAGGLTALGVGGLAYGLTPFGTAASAWLGGWGVAGVAAARFGSSRAQDNAVALSVSTLLAVAVVEAGIRLMRLGESVIEVTDPDYVRQFHHIIPPRAAFLNQPAALDEFPPVIIETNGFGTRGPEPPSPPVDILIIGDSMVEARQLPWDDTLGARLPRALAARAVNATVVSQGVRGWSPLLYWNWYLKVGRRIQPRTVVVFFFWNDLWTSGDEERTFRAVMRPDGRPDHFDVPVESGLVWYKHLRAMRLAGEVAERLELASIKGSISSLGQARTALDLASAEAAARRMAGELVLSDEEVDGLLTQPMDRLSSRARRLGSTGFWPGVRPLDLWTDAQREAAAKTAQRLRLFAEDVAADGGRLVVLYVPNAFQISSSECSVSRPLVGLSEDRILPADSGIQAWLRGASLEAGFELLDPSDAMRDLLASRPAGSPPLYLRADCHWSAAGHQFMADYLAAWYQSAARQGR